MRSEIVDACVLICAGAEWRAFLSHFPQVDFNSTPFGDSFNIKINDLDVCFLHTRSGKVAAAGATQFAISNWQPHLILNLGTCGGIRGQVEHEDVILAEKTIIYDIFNQMSDSDQAIERYCVNFNFSWLPEALPQTVKVGTIASGDRDLLIQDLPDLINKYKSSVADWESGAIAWISQKNDLPCFILRGVSDLVDASGGESYGNYGFFETQCKVIMGNFALNLSAWLKVFAGVSHKVLYCD